MSRITERGAFYSTDDLIRMCHLESFGQYSSMLERAFIKLKLYEQENKQLKELVRQLQNVDEAREADTTNPSGRTVDKLL